jgi:hypothetical protein
MKKLIYHNIGVGVYYTLCTVHEASEKERGECVRMGVIISIIEQGE